MPVADLLLTGTLMVICAFLIAYAAETSQFFVSQGLSLAILAWLQTLPEFAVEAAIAWKAGKDPQQMHLITANFTGSLRLLTGLGCPAVYFISFFSYGMKRSGLRHAIHLKPEHSVEVVALMLGMLLWVPFIFYGRLSIGYGAILIAVYFLYLFVLIKLPPEEEHEDVASVVRFVLTRGRRFAMWFSLVAFLTGGIGIFFIADPFLHSMLAVSLALGIKEFYFVQWVAPFLSEFPEKLSAFGWARRERSSIMGIINLVSSTVNQTTLLVGLIPFIFSISMGGVSSVVFDRAQIFEIKLTVVQVLILVLVMLKMKIGFIQALLMLTLWSIQFFFPSSRESVFLIMCLWATIEVVLLVRSRFEGLRKFRDVLFPSG